MKQRLSTWIFLLVLFVSLILRANNHYKWSALVGLSYLQDEYSQVYGDNPISNTYFTKRLDLRFSSALWSPRLMKYTLLFTARDGDIPSRHSGGTQQDLGYGLQLSFLPLSSHHFNLFYRQNTQDFSRETIPDYTVDMNSWGGDGTLWGSTWELNHTDTQSTHIAGFDTTVDTARLVRGWHLGSTTLDMEARHYSSSMDYYGTTLTNQIFRTTSQTPLPGNGRLWTNLNFFQFEYSDDDLGISHNDGLGVLTLNWNQPWHYRWEMVNQFKTLKSKSGLSAFDFLSSNRFRLNHIYQLETQVGVFTSSQDEISQDYRYTGAGLLVNRMFERWNLEGKGGFRFTAKDQDGTTRDDTSYYADAGLTRSTPKTYLAFSTGYVGSQADISDPDFEDIHFQEDPLATWTRDHMNVRFDLEYRALDWLTLKWATFWRHQTEEYGESISTSDNLYNAMDFKLKNGSVGVKYTVQERESNQRTTDYTAFSFNVNYLINTHLRFNGRHTSRDKSYLNVEETETESYVRFIYTAGKFSAELQYRMLENTGETNFREDTIYSATLTRRFGFD